MTRKSILVALLCLVAGCATFPEVEARETPGAARADYPELVPLGPLLARVETDVTLTEAVPRTIEARVAALRARAARLRGSPLGPAERDRLRRAGQRNAARIAGG